jgi:hypothetical protein
MRIDLRSAARSQTIINSDEQLTVASRQTMATSSRSCFSGSSYVRNDSYTHVSRSWLIFRRLEEAQEPEALSQDTIIANMSAEEAQRLSRVRNIGIAVSLASKVVLMEILLTSTRLILILVKRLLQNESCSTQAV